MKRIQKRVWSLMLSVMILFMMMPIKTYAASYATSYIDQNGAAQQVTCQRIIYSGNITSGWYVINKDVTLTDLVVIGDVNLILADGYALTVTGVEDYAGITVVEGNSLTIYGQTGGTGKLIATGGRYGAGIGADRYGEAAGKVVIRGGTVQATGGNYGAGIGGTGGEEKTGPGGTVIISGGTVIAKSKYWGAGIGGGGYLNGVGGTVSITGGTVYATGGGEDGTGIGGAGIGGGYTYKGGTVTISGGIVNATGVNGGAGIGGGSKSPGEGTNIFTGGKIDATGGFGSAPTDGTNLVYPTTVTLPAGNNNKSVAYKVDAGEFIAATTDEEGKIYLWLTEGQKDIVVADYNKPQQPIFYYWSGTIATGDNNVSVAVKYAPTAKLVVPKQSMMSGESSSFGASDIAEDVDSTELTITKIVQQPNSAYATASLNAGIVTVVSNAIGTTNMVVSVSDGTNTVEVTVPIEVVGMPTVAISITQSPIKTILNAISFGLFYKNDIDVSIQATGDRVDYSEYQIVPNSDTFNENGTWISGNSFSIVPTFKGRIYARAVCTGGIKTDIAIKALVVDNVKPTITASYDASSASIAVSVIDDGAGINTITYKVASGETQTIVLEPSETSDIATQHNFTIEHLLEGQYDVVINSTDNSNNVADSKTISINRTPAVVDATISPTTKSYDLAATSGVQTNITWNSASTVTQVVYDADSTVLTEGTHFTVTGSALTINSSYLQTLKPLVGNSAKFKIYFNAGNPAIFTVDFVDNHTKSDNAKLRDLTINGNTVAGFAADTTNYEVELAYGTVLATVGAQADDAHASVDITQVASLPGTANIQVTAEDLVTTKKYSIHFTLANQTPISHNITIENGGNGTASANVATAVKGTAIMLSATPNSGYEFVQWQVISSVGLNITNNTFVMPDEAVTIKAIFGVKSPDNTDNSGGGNSGGDNSDVISSSKYTTVTIQPEEWPGQPITEVVSVTATEDSSATIPDQVVIDAIAKAQAETKARNKTPNDISVVLNITAPQGKTVLGVIISQTALKALVDAGVSSLEINGLPIRVSFDQKALRAVQSQSSGNVSITAVTRQQLSDRAKTMIGTRPVYNITIGYTKNGSASTVTDLGEGIATVYIPYTLAQGEVAAYLYGVYVDGNDNASRIDGSAYDVSKGCLVFNVKHFSIYGVGYNKPSAKFTDISSHWAEKSIDYVVGRGLLAGNTDTTFSPDAAMTRGMLVTALGRLIGVDSKLYTTNSFTDVKVDSTFSPYIEWAYKNGIIQGIGDNQFAPDRAITREEIAVILQNYAKATGYTLPVTHAVVTFVDASSISNRYSTAVKAMQQAGIMTGDSGNQFNPKTSATRAEVSSMLHRYINNTINPDTAQGWVLNDGGQYLYYKDGKTLTGRQNIDGVKYSFNTAGILQVGWVKDEFGKWYFYSGNTMMTGKWSQIDGNWYYFNNDGSIAVSTKINDYEVDENGVRKIKQL